MPALDDDLDTLHEDDASHSHQPVVPDLDPDDQRDLAALVEAARRNESCAWSGLVQRFTPLVRSVTRRYRLSEHDAEDVAQVVWLRLVEHIQRLREPLALPGWIATTARHESLRLARGHGRTLLVDPLDDSAREFDGQHAEVDAHLLQDEEVEAVREGLAQLPRRNATCCSSSWPTLRSATGRSARSSACRSAASARPGHAPWPGWRQPLP